MFAKVIVTLSLLMLPLCLSFWHKSHRTPGQYRCDVTLYKSVWFFAKDGICGINMISLPRKTPSRSRFDSPLGVPRTQMQKELYWTSFMAGSCRVTWLVFPFWLPTSGLLITVGLASLSGPIRKRYRAWRGRCVLCGYNLFGLKSRRCPECGTDIVISS
ncbi:MAG: hypothetical protein AABZ47_01690 [Planctomycetota bacterium]